MDERNEISVNDRPVFFHGAKMKAEEQTWASLLLPPCSHSTALRQAPGQVQGRDLLMRLTYTCTLESLVGEHTLTAVDPETETVDSGYGTEQANALYFTLDGTTYKVQEDPSDGYRSSMRDITIVEREMVNVFAPCRVLCRHVKGPHDLCSNRNDLLECVDVVTGKVVLIVGTANGDDYYPWYVANFMPYHMASNAESRSLMPDD